MTKKKKMELRSLHLISLFRLILVVGTISVFWGPNSILKCLLLYKPKSAAHFERKGKAMDLTRGAREAILFTIATLGLTMTGGNLLTV